MSSAGPARTVAAALVLATFVAAVPFAEAQPKKDKPVDKPSSGAPKPPDRKACIQSFEDAQTSRKAGKLADAAEHLTTCSHDKCPDITRKPCTQWKTEWANAMPKLTVEVVDSAGSPLADARVILDGQPEKSASLRDLRVDPGSHTVVAAIDGRGEQRTTVTLTEGGAGTARLVFPSLAPAASTAPPPAATDAATTPSRFSTAPKVTYVLGALGVVGLATFAIAGTSGRNDQEDLKTGCAPRCNPADKDDAQRKFIIADVGLVVGVASLGVASYLLLRKRPDPSNASTVHNAWRFDVAGDRGGATGLLSGSF